MSTVPPERGPAILFFTGGTALRGLSSELTTLTHHSIHLVSPFDSGGSSAPLREAFDMLAIGDIRNRMTALLDMETAAGQAFARLLDDRFADVAVAAALGDRLQMLASGSSALVAALPTQLQEVVRADLQAFADAVPSDFNLRGASVGNLTLVGGYLRSGRDINRSLETLSKFAPIHGVIRPTAVTTAHISATLASGKKVAGQHRITSRVGHVDSPLETIDTIDSFANRQPINVPALPEAIELIKRADLICYPMGSFWTSVAANLLPTGIGRAIASSKARKLYIPSTGRDPEQLGTTISSAVEAIATLCRRDTGSGEPTSQFVDSVLLDKDHGRYNIRIDAPGASIIEQDLVSSERANLDHDPVKLAKILMGLALEPVRTK